MAFPDASRYIPKHFEAGKAMTNFEARPPAPQSDLVRQVEEACDHFKGQKRHQRRKSFVHFVTSVPSTELAA